jgi:enoyl-CoA hydratase/carnithine racemase
VQSEFRHAVVDERDGLVEVRLHTDGGSFRWTGDSADELGDLFAALARDSAVRVVILTGTGDRYCDLGYSLDPLPSLGTRDWEQIRWRGEHLLQDLLNIQAPIIACINGPVLSHPEIPLMSDIVLAADDVEIQDEGHFLFNVAPGDGLHILMPLLMGLTRARYFLLTGQKIDAIDALSLGLVNEIWPRDRLLARARELAHVLLTKNPLALRYTRLMMTHHLKGLFHQLLGYGGALEGLGVVDEVLAQSRR